MIVACRFLNEKRLVPHEKVNLRDGDVVSFGGASRVKAANDGPEEANPFVFRVKNLERVVRSAVQRLRPQALTDAQPGSAEFIDLTVRFNPHHTACPT